MKWLVDIIERWNRLKPFIDISKDPQAQFDALSPFEQSYLMDMQRLIDEVKMIHERQADLVFALDNFQLNPSLLSKVKAGRLTPEDKNGGIA